MSNYLKFICPKCGGQQIEEVMVDVTVISLIEVDNDGEANYPAMGSENLDGEVSHYQCHDCGKLIRLVNNLEELVDWLKNQSYNIPSPEHGLANR